MSTLITKDMPEPKEYGPYLVTNPDNASAYPCLLIHDEMGTIGHSWMGDVGWDLWSTVQHQYDGCTIESLADHDARICREALTLTDEEFRIALDTEAKYEHRATAPYLIDLQLTAIAKHRERVS